MFIRKKSRSAARPALPRVGREEPVVAPKKVKKETKAKAPAKKAEPEENNEVKNEG